MVGNLASHTLAACALTGRDVRLIGGRHPDRHMLEVLKASRAGKCTPASVRHNGYGPGGWSPRRSLLTSAERALPPPFVSSVDRTCTRSVSFRCRKQTLKLLNTYASQFTGWATPIQFTG